MDRTPTVNHDKFFVVMLMLGIVLTGFARTLYLRLFLGLPEIPGHLYVHGTVLTAWFLVLFAQTHLVATNRIRIHRRLGFAGALLSVAVVALSLHTVAMRDAPAIDEEPTRALGNVASLIGFLACVVAGVSLRHRPAAHKRLMLLASIQILAPALDRLARLAPVANALDPLLPDALGPTEIGFALVSMLSLLLVVAAHDIMMERRLHPATLGGVLGILTLAPGLSAALMFSGAWRAFVRLVG